MKAKCCNPEQGTSIMPAQSRKDLSLLLLIVSFTVTLSLAVKLMGMTGIIPWIFSYSDIVPWADRAFQPGIPYIDKPMEYPVIMGLVIHAASRWNLCFYLYFNYAVLLFCALITTSYLYNLSESAGSNKKYFLLFWAASPSMFFFSYYNWDMIAIMFYVMAFFITKKMEKSTSMRELRFFL